VGAVAGVSAAAQQAQQQWSAQVIARKTSICLLLLALQDLELVLNQATHPYSTAATGKLHYYLIEGAYDERV